MKNNFLRKFVRNKRAITPVLSELLLTVIAVAAMSIATSATYVITTNLRGSMSERVTVEDVWFKPGTLDVYLNNVGKVDVTVSSVYVNHEGQAPQGFGLKINEHAWFSFSFDWNSGGVYYVDLITDRGTHIAGTYKAP